MIATAKVWRRVQEFRQLVACLVLLAFAFQSYALQTHIHAPLAHVAVSSQAPASGKGPVSNSPMECPLCQAMAHDGIFLEPAVVLAAFFGAGWFLVAPQQQIVHSPGMATHTWQSRAPPKV
jgi:hypothetical protein